MKETDTRARSGFGVMILALTLVLGACTRLDPETLEQVEASREQQADLGGPSNPLADATPQQLECIDDAGERDDLDLEVVVADASSVGVDARAALANIIIECVGDPSTLPSYRAQFTTSIGAALGESSDIDDDEGGCLLSWIVDNAEDPGLTLMGSGTETDAAVVAEGMSTCFDETSQEALSGAEGTGPQAYGDDGPRDALYDECSAGNEPACDLLYVQSSVGSEYHELSIDCAGRGDGVAYCTPGLEVGSDELLLDGAAATETLRDACGAGDMISCDLLLAFAPFGSDVEQFAFTCGERIAVGAIPDCRTRFADLD